ncbi:MAG: hypothetical protein ACOYMA_16630 [Bacteroidia bacterium]
MNKSKLVYYPSKKCIYVYYTKNTKTLKLNTNIKIENVNQFNDKKQSLTKHYKDYQKDNLLLENLVRKINDLINEAISIGTSEIVQYIKNNLDKNTSIQDTKIINKSLSFDISFNDYISTINKKNKTRINRCNVLLKTIKRLKINTLQGIKYNFISTIVDELYSNENNTTPTIKRKVEILKAFLQHIKRQIDSDILNDNIDYKLRKNIHQTNIKFEYDELIELQDYKLKTKDISSNEKIAIDFILLSSLIGCHFKDLLNITKSKIKYVNGNNILTYNRHKTLIECKVPLSNEAIKLMNEYDYKFDIISYSTFSLNLKKVLNSIDIFQQETIIKDLNLNKDIIKQRKDVLTLKSARKYFITNQLQNKISHLSIMKMVGHTSIQELNNYLVAELNDIDSIVDKMTLKTPLQQGIDILKNIKDISILENEINNNLPMIKGFEFE